jgi:RHS repeat-associated protein
LSTVAGGPDAINLADSSIHLSIPIFSRAGRQAPFSFVTTVDNPGWSHSLGQWSVSLGGLLTPIGGTIYTTSQRSCTDSNANLWTYDVYTFSSFQDPSGTTHPIGVIVNDAGNVPCATLIATASAEASDNSGWGIAVDNSLNAVATFHDGTTFVPPVITYNNAAGGWQVTCQGNCPYTLTDSNGNRITYNFVGGKLSTIVDNLGTTVLTQSGGYPNATTWTYTAPSGGAATVTKSLRTYTVESAWGCPGWNEYPAKNFNLTDRITMPDGTYYQFSYETLANGHTTGRLASIRFPTGGTITYAYSGGTGNKIFCIDGTVPTLTRTTPDGRWTYARTFTTDQFGAVNHTVNTVTDPQNNQTVLNFWGNGLEGERQVYSGSATGTPLQTIITCYSANIPSGNAPNPPPSSCTTFTGTAGAPGNFPLTRLTKYRSLDGGPDAVSDTWLVYDEGLPTEADEYDFGATTPTRKTSITYASFGSDMLNRPASVTVIDGSGNLQAKTTYTYDEDVNSLQPSGAAQLFPPTCTSGTCRGNLTTVKTYKTASAFLTKTYTHYDTGQLYVATDVNNAHTTYTYGGCGNSLLTNVQLPLNLSRSYAPNCAGAVVTQTTDENAQPTSTSYTNPYFWRPDSTTDALGNTTTFTYTGAGKIESILPIFSGASAVDVASTRDSLGRPFIRQSRQAPGNTNFDTGTTFYDSAGRPSQTTMPCVNTADTQCPTTSPSTTTTYDGASRPIQVTDGSGGMITYDYWRNIVKQTLKPAPTGENVKKKQLQSDGLGRLTSVCEMTSDPTWSGACSQTNPQTGYWTQYAYNVSPNFNSLTVSQNSQSSPVQTRLYVYDMLGRLTSETNPETANLAYSYIYDSDGTCGTSNGDLVKRVDAKGNVTCYTHDLLHRLLSVTYPSGPNSSGTAKKYFVYDNATVNGQTMLNAKGRMAEAYTCTTCPGTKLTDLGYSYSARGEVKDVYQFTAHSSGYYHLTSSYFPHGALNAVGGVPGMPTIYYGGNNDSSGLDGEGRYLKVTASSGTNPATSVVYTTSGTTQPIGSLTQVTLGSGDNDAFTYGVNTGRLTQYKFNIGATPQSVVGNLTWNANGTLKTLGITDPFNSANTQTCNYGYDDLARVASVSCGATWSQTFTPDPFGNVTKNGSVSFQPGFDRTKNWFLPVGGFDNNGNLLSDVNHTYTYDAENKLTAIDTTALTFDALGRMAEQYDGSTYTQIVYSPAGGKLALMNAQTLKKAFVGLPGGGVAVYGASGTISRYRHPDWLGGSRFASTPGRGLYYDVAYAPYGEKYSDTGTQDLNFTGQNQDTASSTYDFLYREYNPGSSRWTQPDPAGLSAVTMANPQTWNRYPYAGNNPTGNTDPTGLQVGEITTGDFLSMAGAMSGQWSSQAVANVMCDAWAGCGNTRVGQDGNIYQYKYSAAYFAYGDYLDPGACTGDCLGTWVSAHYDWQKVGSVNAFADAYLPAEMDPFHNSASCPNCGNIINSAHSWGKLATFQLAAGTALVGGAAFTDILAGSGATVVTDPIIANSDKVLFQTDLYHGFGEIIGREAMQAGELAVQNGSYLQWNISGFINGTYGVFEYGGILSPTGGVLYITHTYFEDGPIF